MKEIRKIFMMLLVLLCLTTGLIWLKVQKTEGLRFVEGMGEGINIGNSLDVRGLKVKQPDVSIQEYEVYWKNPPHNEPFPVIWTRKS